MVSKKDINFVFFGSTEYSTIVLDELLKNHFIPKLVVTTPDKKQDRGLRSKPTPVKEWANKNDVPVLNPEKLDADFGGELNAKNYSLEKWDVFIVAFYGKIIPKKILLIPEHGGLNLHPSLLPRWRGSSPVQTTILNDENITGVTIIKMDEKMDHGPIVAQEVIEIENWPMGKIELDKKLSKIGGALLSSILEDWIAGNIYTQKQDHNLATFTKKILKADAQISLDDDPYNNLLKIRAYEEWPRAYFLVGDGDKKRRVIITQAHIEVSEEQKQQLVIDKVIPEGRSEMSWEDYKRNL